MRLTPIGRLRTPFATIDACPRNGRQITPAPPCTAEVWPDYQAGLASLDGFTHLILLYWLGAADASADAGGDDPPALCFTPPFDTSPRGVFATRAPRRPNPIGLSVVALDGRSAGVLRVRYLDCLDGTALLDIKPYLPSTDAEPGASMGWLRSGDQGARTPR